MLNLLNKIEARKQEVTHKMEETLSYTQEQYAVYILEKKMSIFSILLPISPLPHLRDQRACTR